MHIHQVCIYPAELIIQVLQFTCQERMPTRKRIREYLGAPSRNKKSRSSSPTSSNAPANTALSSVVPGSIVRASASSSTPAGPAHATGDQSVNPQPPVILVPGKNGAFQKAVQEYIYNLSHDDKAAFLSATDVMEKLRELQKGKSRIPTTRMQRVQKVLQCVQRFLGSIAVCIQHSPQISSLVVGGLHCILTVSITSLAS